MVKKSSFLFLLASLAIVSVLADFEKQPVTETGLEKEHVNVDPKECSLARFSTLSMDMDREKITDPEKFGPLQDQFNKCKLHLMAELQRAVDAIPEDRNVFIGRLMYQMQSMEDGYEATVKMMAQIVQVIAGDHLEKYLDNLDDFQSLYKKAIERLAEPFEGTILDQAKIFEITFGEPKDRESATAFAQRMHDRTNELTLQWIPYAMQIRNLKENQVTVALDVYRYLDHKTSRENYEKSPFRWIAKCFGAEPPKKFDLYASY